ncbi:hypothetical protein JTB14_021930 [Gonioctena quinquepunctata]|nr:hypothetical protein JTB14_021930 [Gonioctena quinquepunctata]
MVHAVIVDIKKHIYLFYTLCEGIAQLDVLQSLANASITNGYVRPYFGEFTEICSAQHPLLDFLLPTKPVSNSIICNDDFNVHIITGPNGSGKSIFIRQVLLLQVMAQVSCYIPAQSAIIKPADRIFARIYLEDNMEYGASSFILEMKEMEYIMTTMTPNSLIVIDELGRSTSLEEGTALAMALLEKLANSSAYIYITSHFTLLTKLYEMYPNINLWQMITVSIGDKPKLFKLDYKYCVEPGVTSVGRYGVYLVRNVWPTEILNFVDDIMDEVTKQCTVNDWNLNILDQKSRIKYSIESEFRKLKLKKELSINNINHVLDKYQLDLQKLGYSITICKISKINTFLQNNIEANTEDNNFTMDDNDLLESEGRIEIFTPEVLMNKSENPQNEVIPQEIQPEITKFSVHEHESPNLFSFNPFKNGSESKVELKLLFNFPSQTKIRKFRNK